MSWRSNKPVSFARSPTSTQSSSRRRQTARRSICDIGSVHRGCRTPAASCLALHVARCEWAVAERPRHYAVGRNEEGRTNRSFRDGRMSAWTRSGDRFSRSRHRHDVRSAASGAREAGSLQSQPLGSGPARCPRLIRGVLGVAIRTADGVVDPDHAGDDFRADADRGSTSNRCRSRRSSSRSVYWWTIR